MAIKGHRRPLEPEDLWDLNERDTSKHLLEKFQKHWDEHLLKSDVSRNKPRSWFENPGNSSLSRTIQGRRIYIKSPPTISAPLFKTFKWPFLAGTLYKLIYDLMQFVFPYLLKHLINFIEDKTKPMWIGIGISVLMLSLAFVKPMVFHQHLHIMFRIGMNTKSILTSVVYKKALFLSNKARKNRTVGEIITLMSVDIQRIENLTNSINLLWSVPFQLLFSLYFLFQILGIAAVGGFFILIMMVPLNYFISVKIKNCQVQKMKFQDERLKMTSEVLNGMKVLKLYAWEESMKKIILEIRQKEIKILRKLAYLNAIMNSNWYCVPFLASVVMFGTYVIIDPEKNILTPQVTFVALSIFNIMRFPLTILTMITNQVVQSHVSNKRLKSFLMEDEIESPPPLDNVEKAGSEEDAEEVKEVLEDLKKLDPMKEKEIQRQISTSLEMFSQDQNPGSVSSPRKSEGGRKSVEQQEKVPLLNEGQVNNAMKKSENLLKINEKSKLIVKEGVETGKVKFNVYWSYLKAINFNVVIFFLILYIISNILGLYSNLYLADWSDHATEIQKGENRSTELRTKIGVYTVLGIGQVLFICIASLPMALGMIIASKVFHEKMLTNILRSPMAFFDVTPLGRILNRFGKEIYTTDATLPASMISTTSTIIQAIFTIIVPVIVTPWILAPLIPIAYGYFKLLKFYISTSRQLKRLESTMRSPIYSHFQESIQGTTSIRAYKCTKSFILESQKRVDNNLTSYYPMTVANRWLSVRLELIGNSIVLLSALLGVLLRDNSGITPGLLGLSVTYALTITQVLNWSVRVTGEFENNIVAVERIKEYSETPTEAALETGFELPKDWPTRGSVNFEDLKVRYRPDLDLVLKGISGHIGSEEKIGIIGRTGAGKSSLTLALFRLIEPSSGRILIDKVDIADIGLTDLRSKLTIVPQDPVLFSGTLRTNLDPFKKHTDEELWEALKLTHMDTYVSFLTGFFMKIM
ncbi:hypothetical protein FO519_008982 [Halicephalobus sp. NKZ332]|nr:hypothetical protein FO519_008982 [Halicephalobus sp. NKZ332]